MSVDIRSNGVATPISIANGGTNNSVAYTAGSVVFSDGTKLTEDNSNLFWDDTTNSLGVGTLAPTETFSVPNGGAQFGGGSVNGFTTINQGGGIGTGDTTMVLTSVSGMPPRGTLQIGGNSNSKEWVTYTSISGSTIQGMTRGQFGTTATAVADGTVVRLVSFKFARSNTGIPQFALIENLSVIYNGTNNLSDITGLCLFKFFSTSIKYFGVNTNDWFEISDGTNQMLFGVNGSTNCFMGSYTSEPFVLRVGNSQKQIIFTDGGIEFGGGSTTPGQSRIALKGGTSVATTDWALTSGWGANASISAVTGNDSRGTVTVQTSALDTPTLNPVITLTFKNGTWTTAPFAVTNVNSNSTGVLGASSCKTTATTLVVTYDGTPTALTSATYVFNHIVIG